MAGKKKNYKTKLIYPFVFLGEVNKWRIHWAKTSGSSTFAGGVFINSKILFSAWT